MSSRKIAALALSGVLLAGGTGAAIAAATRDDDGQGEQQILDDAAQRLGVTPQKLHDALRAAQDAQLDKAVADGKLTKEQGDAIKARRKQSGRLFGRPLAGPHGMRHRPRFGPHAGARRAILLDLADALGITRRQLREQLRDGRSVADIAKAQGKTLGDVRASARADAKRRLDKAVKGGDLTQSQADRMLARLDKGLDHLGERLPRMKPRLHGGGPPDLRPGAFVPDPGEAPAPDVALVLG